MLNVLEPRDEFQILETVENDTHCIYLYYSPHDATTLLCVASDEETSGTEGRVSDTGDSRK